MGRQVGVAMTAADEREFLEFLKSTANIQLLLPKAPDIESIYINEFPSRDETEDARNIDIWNNDFGLSPELVKNAGGNVYVKNISARPVLQYTPHRFAHKFNPHASRGAGRLYWPRGFDPAHENARKYNNYAYDTKEFEKWYEKVVRWIKKNGSDRRGIGFYYMPHTSKWYT